MKTAKTEPIGQHFCNYEHLGGCSDTLTVRADYWLGAARRRFGPYAYWCGAHAATIYPSSCRGPVEAITPRRVALKAAVLTETEKRLH